MTDEKNGPPKAPPIVPQEFHGGVTVVDIGDLRVARGLSRRPHSACRHLRMAYDTSERRIWCQDCETNVEPFDAFRLLVENYDKPLKALNEKQRRLEEAEKFQIRGLAAKALDEAWRSRTMVPACPCCSNGLFPEDFKNGTPVKLGRDYALARRAAIKKGPTT